MEIELKELKATVENAAESVKAMKTLAENTSKETKAALVELEKKMNETLAKEYPTLDALQTAITEVKAANAAAMQKVIDDVNTERKERKDKPGEIKSFRAQVKEAFEGNEEYKAFKAAMEAGKKHQKPFEVEVKSAVTVGIDNTILDGGSASHYLLTYNTGIISRIRKRVLQYLKNVSVGTVDPARPVAMWVEELDEQGTPIFIGEGDAKTQLSVRYEEREAKAKKIGVYTKVTTEMMRYLPQFISYIQNNLMRRLDIKTEDQLFNGDGTGDNLKGLSEYASAFTGGSLAGTVQNPNVYDVLRAVVLQVAQSFGIASGIFVNPGTVAQMELSKDSEGRYLLPPFIREDGRVIAGMRIIETNALEADEFMGGELEVINVYFTDGLSVQVGLDGNDFTTNKRTILVEQQLVQFVSANDTQVLVQGTFTDAIALLAAA